LHKNLTMKKIFGFIPVILLLLFIQACNKESAEDYNNKIVLQQKGIVEEIDNLKKSIDDYNVLPASDAITNMDNAYNSTVFKIDSAIAFLETVEPYKNDESLLEAAKVFFTTYKQIVEDDYKQIIELYKLPDKMFTQDDQQKLDDLINSTKVELDESFEKFLKVQQEFSKEYDLNLI